MNSIESRVEIYKVSTVLHPPSMDAAWKKARRRRELRSLLKWFGMTVVVGAAVLYLVNWVLVK